MLIAIYDIKAIGFIRYRISQHRSIICSIQEILLDVLLLDGGDLVFNPCLFKFNYIQIIQILQLAYFHHMANYLQTFLQDYVIYHSISFAIIVMIVVLILVHHAGSEQNLVIAKQYKQILDQFLNKHFKEYDGQMLVESSNIIKLYPSGRETCLFAILAFALVPRQQIISYLFNSTFIHLKDELVIQIPILNQNPISLTMAIIHKKSIKQLTKKKYPDIKQLCKEYKPILNPHVNVPDTHSILIEKVQHYKYFLYNQEDLQIWKEHGKSVKMVYMSDINKFSRYPMTVRMVIILGKDVLPLVGWLINYVDRMSKIRMSSGQRRQARKRREGLNLKYDS